MKINTERNFLKFKEHYPHLAESECKKLFILQTPPFVINTLESDAEEECVQGYLQVAVRWKDDKYWHALGQYVYDHGYQEYRGLGVLKELEQALPTFQQLQFLAEKLNKPQNSQFELIGRYKYYIRNQVNISWQERYQFELSDLEMR